MCRQIPAFLNFGAALPFRKVGDIALGNVALGNARQRRTRQRHAVLPLLVSTRARAMLNHALMAPMPALWTPQTRGGAAAIKGINLTEDCPEPR